MDMYLEKETTGVVHNLKIEPTHFGDVLMQTKTFEIRRNDRNFQVGDTIYLNEYYKGEFTGSYVKGAIRYIFYGGEYGLNKDYCVFSFEITERGRKAKKDI